MPTSDFSIRIVPTPLCDILPSIAPSVPADHRQIGTAMDHIGEHRRRQDIHHRRVFLLSSPCASHPDASVNRSTVRTFLPATHPYVVVGCVIFGEFLLFPPTIRYCRSTRHGEEAGIVKPPGPRMTKPNWRSWSSWPFPPQRKEYIDATVGTEPSPTDTI